jgi:hypothetical protein
LYASGALQAQHAARRAIFATDVIAAGLARLRMGRFWQTAYPAHRWLVEAKIRP